ncbi:MULTISPECIES: response regulator [Acaryochloris]|uniref:Response regulator n=1 Tax=Acaryochloris marina (strain MBIC 11017) TaxID=329726 RepID=B0C2H5_ACAM1|nr:MULTISPECIES: response regulator [Acaryochloris]ABW29765.1 response regulator [Acaryochloris marina MBIC11017]KAI9133158.1 response regulator [Acaryochloris sp. CCMEE 5410]BDM78655.1 response regulator [Acaryochloris marina MBIC10699]
MVKPVVLCVDDEKVILDSLKIQIKKELSDLCNVEAAINANEALEIVEELQEDGVEVVLVLCDWLMPGMKGDEFFVKLHQDHPNIIKIMLSGQADHSAIERAKEEADLHRFIHKPWRKSELIELLKSNLEAL